MIELPDRDSLFPQYAAGFLFLNHAGVSPVPATAARVLHAYVDELLAPGPDTYAAWWSGVARARELVATLVGATTAEIAFVPSTTVGVAIVANGLDLRPGDRVLGFDGDYPANVFPWRGLADHGLAYEVLPAPCGLPDLAALERALAAGGVRVVALSTVCFWSGARAPLERIVELAHAAGALVCVDGMQSLGALALDVRRVPVDFLVAGGNKWLLGPQGAGFLYVRRELLERLRVTLPGSDSVTPVLPFLAYARTWRDDAARHEGGTRPVAQILALAESVRLLVDVGLERVEAQVLANATALAERLAAAGYELALPRAARAERSGIVAARHPRRAPAEVVQALSRERIFVIEREGWVRFAPHFYQREADAERVGAALPR